MAKSKSGMAVPRRVRLERLGDVLHQAAVVRLGFRRVALEHPAVAADEELLEVPADVAGHAAARGGEELVDRVAVGAVDVDFPTERKGHIVGAAAEADDLSLAARLLAG